MASTRLLRLSLLSLGTHVSTIVGAQGDLGVSLLADGEHTDDENFEFASLLQKSASGALAVVTDVPSESLHANMVVTTSTVVGMNESLRPTFSPAPDDDDDEDAKPGWKIADYFARASPGPEVKKSFLLNSSRLPITVQKSHLSSAKAAEEVRDLAKDGMLPAVSITLLSLVLGSLISSSTYTKFIPETLCTVLVSVGLGFFIRNMLSWGWISLSEFTVVDATLLNLFLLPIIIFEGGWSVNLPHFMAQFPYILIFAILGTMISITILGTLSWTSGRYLGLHPMTGFRANFAFASLISATDPVATLTTFAQLQIADKQPLLNTLVFGESMINDAVAIVFFNAFNHAEVEPWHDLLVRMIVLMFGSMLVGVLTASFLVFILRIAKLPGNTIPEVIYIFLCPFLVYSLAETCFFSGIIATLFAGIVMRLYGTHHLSEAGAESANHFLEIVARLADSGVFIMCGTSAALISSAQGFQYGVFALGLCLVSRAASVLMCSGLSNKLKRLYEDRTEEISWRHQFMIWLSGLRGGLGLVLALEIDEKLCGEDNKSMIINTTFFLVCALLLLCGGTTQPCLRMLGFLEDGGESSAGSTSSQTPTLSQLEALPRSTTKILEQQRAAGPLHRFLLWALVGTVNEK